MTGLRFLTAGESHGRGIVVIIDGIPAGLAIDQDYIARDLKRRQSGYGRGGRMKIEHDRAEIISGVRRGITMGSPISLLVWNLDWDNWRDVMAVGDNDSATVNAGGIVRRPRPGHADLPGVYKYGLRDIRPILERSSARETVGRVTAGAVARKLLAEFGITIHSHTQSIGVVKARTIDSPDWHKVEESPVRCADTAAEKSMVAAIDSARANGDTLGGTFEVIAYGLPVGLGSHVHWDRRLDGMIAQVVMSIPSVKAVEIGVGFAGANLTGSQVHDAILPAKKGLYPWQRPTNRAGGIEGGMTNGEPIVVRAAVKPISTMMNPLPSIDLASGKSVDAHFERADICIVPAAGIIGEAMLALVLAQALMEKFGGDNLDDTLAAWRRYRKTMKLWSGRET